MSNDEARTPVTAGELFEQHHLAIYRYFCRMVQHPATAEDLVQETFVRVVKSLPRYRRMGRDTAWVFRTRVKMPGDRRRTSMTPWSRSCGRRAGGGGRGSSCRHR